MKKQNLKKSYQVKKTVSFKGMRGIAQSFVNIGIPAVLESPVHEDYSYLNKQGQKSILHSFVDEVKIKL